MKASSHPRMRTSFRGTEYELVYTEDKKESDSWEEDETGKIHFAISLKVNHVVVIEFKLQTSVNPPT
jgi:hypothetical protein